jgi:tetratricopeptide (TPR) repeat protein
MGFSLVRFDYTGGGHFAETPLVRLFRSDPGIRYFRSRAHASVVPAIEKLGGRITSLHAPLHHLDALVPGRHERKRARMITRLTDELADGGMPVMHCFLALELFRDGRHEEATRHLEWAVEKNPGCQPISRLFRAQQALRLGQPELAAQHAQWVIDSAPQYRGRSGAFVVLAEVLHQRGEPNEAISLLRRAVTEVPYSAALHLNLAALLGALDIGEARTHLALARKLNPWLGDRRIEAAAPPNIFQQQQMTMSVVAPFSELAARLQWSFL